MFPPVAAAPDLIQRVAKSSTVPVWLPWPLPEGWLVSGLRYAGDDRAGLVACVLAASGPNPLPEVEEERAADLLLVAEQPMVGLGARLAGLDEVDAGVHLRDLADREPAHVKVNAGGHEVPLWSVPVEEGLGFAGEALGVWFWILA